MIRFLIVSILLFSNIYAISLDEVKHQLHKIINSLNSSTKAGILIIDPLTQDTIYQLNPAVSRIPASNTKLFTTATALNLLGGDFPIATKIFSDDLNIKDGIVNGNLFLKGYGNPEFSSGDLEKMVNELKAKNIKLITGNIVGDDTYFDDIYSRDDWIKNEVANVKLPPISALVLDRNRRIVQTKRGRRIRRSTQYINDPPLYAAQILKEKLEEAGIKVNGTNTKGSTPENLSVLSEKKILLRDLIALINKHSDNFYAEVLFKTIGAAASGQQGNSFFSTQAVLNFIEDNAIFKEGTSVVDGSGISRFNQITAGAIVGILEKMYFDLKNYDDFYNSLSIAGIDGTLRHRMSGTPAENNMRGKTGTLNGVSSLSGYVTALNGEDVVVSIIFEYDRGSANYYRSIQDKIVETVAGWDE
ncbi:MAG: D-alanyl-D-alanine carboxypeptidase/D-alanyl-D-alanine-endopeptidase [Ignavibacteriaceae bacterium]|nr:D-alanyl-D-alanine carboxypeptidase/D-alanyl-D-alanine-endopeptidase [Ignavibacteriaceae bacterium]